MKFDPTKPVQTRNGRKARIICTDLKSLFNEYPIIAAVELGDGTESPFEYTIEGSIYKGNSSSLDLINAPIEHEGWVNIYANDSPVTYGFNRTRQKADENARGLTRLACVHIKFKEGEGL